MKNNMTNKLLAVFTTVTALAALGCQSKGSGAEASPNAPSKGIVSRIFTKPEPLILPEATTVRVRTTVTVSTKSHRTGDEFSATLEDPIVVGNRVVAPKGSEVRGIVANSDPGGRVKGRAALTLRLTAIETGGGDWVDVHTNTFTRLARSTRKTDAAKIGIASGVGAAIGAIAGGGTGAAIGAAAGGGAGTGTVLATRGAPALVSGESLLTFRLTAPATVNSSS